MNYCLFPKNKAIQIRLIAFVLLFISTNICQAQNYIKGFVITLEGDTIQGMIDYTEWNHNPDWIDFKPADEVAAITYEPKEIAGFKLKSLDWLYYSKQVDLDISPRQLEKLRTEPTPKISNQHLFLQVLVLGDVNLYFYRNPSTKQHFFIDNKEIPLQELIYHRYLKSEEKQLSSATKPKEYVVENEKYKGQLNYALRKCPSIQQDIDALYFDYDAFSQLFDTYNACVQKDNPDAQAIFRSDQQQKRLDYGLIVGVNQTNILFAGGINRVVERLDFEESFNIIPGGFISIPISKYSNVWVYHGDLMLKAMKATTSTFDTTTAIKQTRNYTIGKLYGKANHFLKIQPLNKKRINPYIALGVSTAFAFVSINEVIIESNRSNPIKSLLWDGEQTIEFGLIGAIGIQAPMFFIEFRYEGTNGITEHTSTINSTTRGMGVFAGVYLSELRQRRQEVSRSNRYNL